MRGVSSVDARDNICIVPCEICRTLHHAFSRFSVGEACGGQKEVQELDSVLSVDPQILGDEDA